MVRDAAPFGVDALAVGWPKFRYKLNQSGYLAERVLPMTFSSRSPLGLHKRINPVQGRVGE
jgi:hypothetical protein